MISTYPVTSFRRSDLVVIHARLVRSLLCGALRQTSLSLGVVHFLANASIRIETLEESSGHNRALFSRPREVVRDAIVGVVFDHRTHDCLINFTVSAEKSCLPVLASLLAFWLAQTSLTESNSGIGWRCCENNARFRGAPTTVIDFVTSFGMRLLDNHTQLFSLSTLFIDRLCQNVGLLDFVLICSLALWIGTFPFASLA